MGGGHSDPTPVQTCGASISISGDAHVDLGNATTGGTNCSQGTTSSSTGSTTGVTVSPTITIPGAKSAEKDALMNLLALNGVVVTNPGVNVADHTNTNPGVLIADKSVLYSQQPGVKFYNDTFENAGAKYYEAVLQNPGV